MSEPIEIMPEETTAIVIRESGLQAEQASTIQASYAGYFRDAKAVMDQSRQIVVTDASQTLQIKMSRECRLALRKIRCDAEKTKTELKAESLRKGKAIDGFFNILKDLIGTEETRLMEQEKIAERKEAERLAALKADRTQALAAIGYDPQFVQVEMMSAEMFAVFLATQKEAQEKRIADAKRIEEERIAKILADNAERERIRAENERLLKEAAEKEAALKAEREAVAKAQREADEKARLEREAIALAAKIEREAAEREAKRLADEAAAVLRAEQARLEGIAKAEREQAAKAAKEAAAKAAAELAETRRVQRLSWERAAAERKAIEEQARKDREERDRLQREADAKLAAEVKAKADAEAEQRRRAAAPDLDKVRSYIQEVASINVGTLTDSTAIEIAAQFERNVKAAAQFAWSAISKARGTP